jgi:hypothetical protein
MSLKACVDKSKMALHADTCAAGCNMVVLEDTGETVSVTCSFHLSVQCSERDSQNVGSMANDCRTDVKYFC